MKEIGSGASQRELREKLLEAACRCEIDGVLVWYYYLEGKIRFPFQAKCIVAKVVLPLVEGETVEVRSVALGILG